MYRVSLKHHKHATGKTASAAQHAAYILRDVKTPETQGYVTYVLRQSRASQDREDLAHAESHNLPSWAGESPIAFFLEAERWEGANRRVSSSLEVALPKELDRAQQIALMQDFCQTHFAHCPYLVGLHDSQGASGEPNPHFHVTWSARVIDGVERPPETFFKRPPHGAGKDPIFLEEGWLTAVRQSWADLCNLSLERNGVAGAFVDARSLAERGIERDPERRLSPDHTTKAKLGKGHTDEWAEVLRQRQEREADRAIEQALATDTWKERKLELGIQDVQSLDRETGVKLVRAYTHAAVWQKTQQPSITQLQEYVQATEQSYAGLSIEVNRLHSQVMMLTHQERQAAQERPHAQPRFSPLPHTPGRQQSVHTLTMDDDLSTGGLHGPDLDRKRGRDGFSW
jgi:hypothetical protein